MKKILFFLISCFLISCGTTSKEIVSNSSDNKYQIKVFGTKASSMDPFMTNIVVTGNDMSDTLMTEIFASDLNEETVKFAWSDNENCIITFKQSDADRSMSVSFANNKNTLYENK